VKQLFLGLVLFVMTGIAQAHQKFIRILPGLPTPQVKQVVGMKSPIGSAAVLTPPVGRVENFTLASLPSRVFEFF